MTSELQIQKLDRAFDQIDVNSNGQIERDDLIALGNRLILGFGQPASSEKGRDVLQLCDALWAELAEEADIDHDDSISPAEFRHAMINAYIEGKKFDKTFAPATRSWIVLADHDGDDLVALPEFRTMHQAFGTEDDATQTAFAALDVSGGGRLAVPDLVVAAREYYTSADPKARGNLFFGAL
ncbi:MAG TPA: EF-hand domain-containing protein [Candidatus Limnocylindrales bacterium]